MSISSHNNTSDTVTACQLSEVEIENVEGHLLLDIHFYYFDQNEHDKVARESDDKLSHLLRWGAVVTLTIAIKFSLIMC